MTKTTMTLKLECLGRELILGPGQTADITKVTGLESTEIDVGLTDLAVEDGSSHDGTHVKARPIHIEGSFKSSRTSEADREFLIRFFNPSAGGVLTATVGSRTRHIEYLLEGWSLKERRTLDVNVGFVADLICPDPNLRGPDIVVTIPPGGSVEVVNDGDKATGWTAEITSSDGTLKGPRIELGEYYMSVGGGIVPGELLVISTEPRTKTATLDGVSVFQLLDRMSTPFRIPVGGAVISASAAEGEAAMSCKLTYNELFNGV